MLHSARTSAKPDFKARNLENRASNHPQCRPHSFRSPRSPLGRCGLCGRAEVLIKKRFEIAQSVTDASLHSYECRPPTFASPATQSSNADRQNACRIRFSNDFHSLRFHFWFLLRPPQWHGRIENDKAGWVRSGAASGSFQRQLGIWRGIRGNCGRGVGKCAPSFPASQIELVRPSPFAWDNQRSPKRRPLERIAQATCTGFQLFEYLVFVHCGHFAFMCFEQ